MADREALIVEQQAIQRGSVLLPNTNGFFASSFNKPPTNLPGKTNYIGDIFPSPSSPNNDKSKQRGNTTSRPAVTMCNVGRQDVHGVNTGNTFSALG